MIQGTTQLQAFLKQYPNPIVAIGGTSFPRTGCAFLVPNYQIICIRESTDVTTIRGLCTVLTLENDLKGEMPTKQNTSSILALPQVKEYLKGLGSNVSLLVYKSTPKTELAIEDLGITLIGNTDPIRDPFEDKKQFRVLADQAGLPLLPGETVKTAELNKLNYQKWQATYGQRLVFQLTDYKVGGGIGTKFVNSYDDMQYLIDYIERKKDEKILEWVNVTPFVDGIAASITGMITRQGILAGPLQMQLLDVPQVTAFYGRNGVFCGHDWTPDRFSSYLQLQAEQLVQTLGAFMAKKDYKGIFGIDVIVDFDRQKVYPIECNARYTGAFPTYSMLQLAEGEISFDAFQLAEFLNLDYAFDLERVQQSYRQSKTGAQLILHNQTRRWVKVGGHVVAGVYRFSNGQLERLRSGFSMQDIADSEREFVLTDGVAVQGGIYKPGSRLGRALFRRSVAKTHTQIDEYAVSCMDAIYKAFDLFPLSSDEIDQAMVMGDED